jgi:S-adenosylmethionine:tRNA-ribosyltransferase-isomerase (queuine synthetase)
MKGIVDRFEGSKVVVEMEDGKKMEIFDRKLFPENLREGDVVIFKNDRFIVDELETEKRKAYIENLFKRLTDKGMD